jgi:DNA-directed RNA polymerase specialized sigma24 family protein
MFEMSSLHEDSLREYDELELCYSESGLYLVLSDNDLASVLSFIVDLHKKKKTSFLGSYLPGFEYKAISRVMKFSL